MMNPEYVLKRQAADIEENKREAAAGGSAAGAGPAKSAARLEAESIPFPKFNSRAPKYSAQFRAMFHMRWQSWMAAGVFAVGTWFMAVPTFVEHWSDIFGTNIKMEEDRSKAMPVHKGEWWLNEWRKGIATWRRGESYSIYFYEPVFDYLKQTTGKANILPRDEKHLLRPLPHFTFADDHMDTAPLIRVKGAVDPAAKSSSPATSTPLKPPAIISHDANAPPASPTDKKKPAAAVVPSQDPSKPQALVPLCGDSMIMYHLANHGFQVHGIDISDVAFRNFVERAEQWDPDGRVTGNYNVMLLWHDVFSGALWQRWPHHSFDLIYDRQGISAFPPGDLREDYSFLLKRALKPGGVMYVEGIDRTPRVKGNTTIGPPFALHEDDIRSLFPERDGWMVKCREVPPITEADLTAEAKVTRRIPKELYAREFPCAVWKPSEIPARKA